MKCKDCGGTGRCSQCKGTTHFGYPGFGRLENYKTLCTLCRQTGVCLRCRGTGKQ